MPSSPSTRIIVCCTAGSSERPRIASAIGRIIACTSALGEMASCSGREVTARTKGACARSRGKHASHAARVGASSSPRSESNGTSRS